MLGDVELHVRSSDFRAHGHHLDPRYDRVVLHLVFGRRRGLPPTPIGTAGGYLQSGSVRALVRKTHQQT